MEKLVLSFLSRGSLFVGIGRLRVVNFYQKSKPVEPGLQSLESSGIVTKSRSSAAGAEGCGGRYMSRFIGFYVPNQPRSKSAP